MVFWSVVLLIGLPMASAGLLNRTRDRGNEESSLDAGKRSGWLETIRIIGLLLVAGAVQGIGRELTR